MNVILCLIHIILSIIRKAIELYTNGLIHFFGTGYDVMNNQYGSYVDVISKLDVEYKKDLLSDVRLNERDFISG